MIVRSDKSLTHGCAARQVRIPFMTKKRPGMEAGPAVLISGSGLIAVMPVIAIQ
jgi:hypothetical protein